VLAGQARCIEGAAGCDTSFGAAMFEVIEVEAPESAPAAQENSPARK
jgi:hypothetical protein